MSSKNSFIKILKTNNGLDDKIRAAGLPSVLADEIAGMDPKDAKKVLGRITGKNGKLNKEGRRLVDLQMAGQISGTLSAAQTGLTQTNMQRRATTSLRGRGASAEAISAITGDITKTEEYIFLLDKVKAGVKGADQQLNKYINTLTRQEIAQKAANSETERAIVSRELDEQIKMAGTARGRGMNPELIDYISGDAGLMAEYSIKSKGSKQDLDAWFAGVESDFNKLERVAYESDPFAYFADKAQESFDAIEAEFEALKLSLSEESDSGFLNAFGKGKDDAELLIQKNEALISQYQEQVDHYTRLNEQEQKLVEGQERQKKQWQDKIDSAQKYIDGQQRSIDLLQKEVDVRNKQASALNHDLDLISKAEEGINETYEKRMNALDQVERVNDRILQSQRDQLSISQALSTGDVYAAAAAVQEMRENQVSQASEDARDALTTARDNQVEGLRGSTGQTRAQIEEQLWQINQQNYQTSLQIYAIEDKIYAKNQEIYGWKSEINKIDDSIRVNTDKIWANNGEILKIQRDMISPLTQENELWSGRLKTSQSNLDYSIATAKVQGQTMKYWEAANTKVQTQAKRQKAISDIAKNTFKTWVGIVGEMDKANQLAKDRNALVVKGDYEKLGLLGIDAKNYLNEDGVTYDTDKMLADINAAREEANSASLARGADSIAPQYAVGGQVNGDGSRDSINARLTPGEFVVRKPMVKKYGQSMLEKINQGSFNMPRYSASRPTTTAGKSNNNTNVVAPVYNSYSISVPVNQPNASADEIAYKVMTKIKSIESSSIRRVNGY